MAAIEREQTPGTPAFNSTSTSLVGIRTGNYILREKIAEGAMAAVYRAEHQIHQREVAVKVLHGAIAAHEELADRFVEEARVTNVVRDAHVVDLIETGELAGGARYIALEWLEGRTLGYHLRTEAPRMSLWRALHIARGIARGLAAVHARGFVHGDLKPDNVYLVFRDDDPDFVKLIDFGVAVEAGRAQPGLRFGTPLYMSPEQCGADGTLTAASDLYALGVILFELLAGQPPFSASRIGDLLFMHSTRAVPSLRAFDQEVPASIEALVTRALDKDPFARFRSADEFIAAIDAAEAVAEAAPATVDDEPIVVPPRDVRPMLAVAFVAGLLLALPFSLMRAPTRAVVAPAPIAGPAPPAAAPVASIAPITPITSITPTSVAHRAPAPLKVHPAVARSVTIEIRTSPAGAELRVDDERVANPFRLQVERGDWQHLVEVRAPGFTARSTFLTYDHDQRIWISLSPDGH